MRLKMAPNSLFAVLLRSPWWISIAVALTFALAAGALLPNQYKVFGMMGGFPFLVIGLIAAWRQLRALSAPQVERTLQRAAAMPWREFCVALEQAYTRQGYGVSRLDGRAADLLVAKAGRSTLVAGRRWKAANHGVEPLRNLADARRAQDVSHCVYVTLSDVGDKTQRFARDNQIELLHGSALAELLAPGLASRPA